MIVIIVMGLVIVGFIVVVVVMKRSNHTPSEPELEHRPPAVTNPTFVPDASYEEPTPLAMQNRHCAEIDDPSKREPVYNTVQMYDQVPRGTAQHDSLEGLDGRVLIVTAQQDARRAKDDQDYVAAEVQPNHAIVSISQASAGRIYAIPMVDDSNV